PVEGLFLDDGRDLGAEAHPGDCLVRDDATVRLLHGLDDGCLVKRLQRTGVDDLDGHALLLRLLRRGARLGPAACPDAASASCTRRPVATTVTSSPWRWMRACPSGIGSSSSGTSS